MTETEASLLRKLERNSRLCLDAAYDLQAKKEFTHQHYKTFLAAQKLNKHVQASRKNYDRAKKRRK